MNEPELWERYPNIRRGETRKPLPDGIRDLVLMRDRYLCKHCGRGGELQVDHIVPWSAGGSDKTTNLRTLCTPCNQGKSNFRYWGSEEEFPIAVDCDRCHRESDDDEVEWGSPLRQERMWCLTCRRTSLSSQPEGFI